MRNIWLLKNDHCRQQIEFHPTPYILKLLMEGRISPYELIWNEVLRAWKPICEWSELKANWPNLQNFNKFADHEKEWVVWSGKEGEGVSGPYSIQEIKSDIIQKKWTQEARVWSRGMTGWACLSEREEFVLDFSKSFGMLGDDVKSKM